MRRTDRLFEIIQILRSETRSITADEIASRLEVSVRTIYRDIQTLQAMRTPIEGEAGVGYLMRQGYDLPALNFSAEEVEAIVVERDTFTLSLYKTATALQTIAASTVPSTTSLQRC